MAETTSQAVEQELGELLGVERFDPPEDFAAEALITDTSEHERAASDPQGWWAEQARALHWFEEWDTVLDDSNPPFYKWFVGGTLNASYNCLDRHVEAGLGNRVAFHWRGEEGEVRDITYEELHRDVQRFANALKERGIAKGDVVGI
jgi:acetyl-CoA synthetase